MIGKTFGYLGSLPEISLVLLCLAAKEKWYNCTFLLAENNYKVFKRLLKLESSVQFLNGIFSGSSICAKSRMCYYYHHHSFIWVSMGQIKLNIWKVWNVHGGRGAS